MANPTTRRHGKAWIVVLAAVVVAAIIVLALSLDWTTGTGGGVGGY